MVTASLYGLSCSPAHLTGPLLANISGGGGQYFECHGTGTAAGDPIEAQAISEAFFPQGESNDRMYVGSIKTVVGHLEGCAGLAGLLKASLASLLLATASQHSPTCSPAHLTAPLLANLPGGFLDIASLRSQSGIPAHLAAHPSVHSAAHLQNQLIRRPFLV